MKIKKTYNNTNFVNFIFACQSFKNQTNTLTIENNFVSLVAYPGTPAPQKERLLPRPSTLLDISL